jgi:8-oxo-dGTP pyrophosphatase MutT (NUDIX family)/GNAT superfamily N-acetyltransferase
MTRGRKINKTLLARIGIGAGLGGAAIGAATMSGGISEDDVQRIQKAIEDIPQSQRDVAIKAIAGGTRAGRILKYRRFLKQEKEAADIEFKSFVSKRKGKRNLDRIDAIIDGKNVGYITSHPETDDPEAVWIKGMFVDPDHRGQGIARKLIQMKMEEAPGKKLRLRPKPFKDAPMDEDQLKSFYGSLGFKEYDKEGRMEKMAYASASEIVDYWKGIGSDPGKLGRDLPVAASEAGRLISGSEINDLDYGDRYKRDPRVSTKRHRKDLRTMENIEDFLRVIDQFIEREKSGSLNKLAVIQKREDGYYVTSKKGKNLGGPYASRGKAEKRLAQVEYFKEKNASLDRIRKQFDQIGLRTGQYAIHSTGSMQAHGMDVKPSDFDVWVAPKEFDRIKGDYDVETSSMGNPAIDLGDVELFRAESRNNKGVVRRSVEIDGRSYASLKDVIKFKKHLSKHRTKYPEKKKRDLQHIDMIKDHMDKVSAIIKVAINYRPRVEAIVLKGLGTTRPKVLLQHKDDVYLFPGGGIDPGEEATEAAERETGEEAGVNTRNHEHLQLSVKRKWTKREMDHRKRKGKTDMTYRGSMTEWVAAEHAPGKHELYGIEGDEQKPIWWTVDKAMDYLKEKGKEKGSLGRLNNIRFQALQRAVNLESMRDG